MAVLLIPGKGVLHPRAVPAEGTVSPHLRLSKHKVFAAGTSEDGFGHDAAGLMEQGRRNVGRLLPPWDDNFKQRAGSSCSSMSTAVTLVRSDAERRGAALVQCLSPLAFAFAQPLQQAEPGLAENSSPPSTGRDPCVALCAAPRHWGKRAHLRHAAATAAFKRTFSTLGLGSAHLTASREQPPFKRLLLLCNPSKWPFHLL